MAGLARHTLVNQMLKVQSPECRPYPGVGFEFAMAAVNPPGGSVSDAGWSIMSFFRDRPPIEEGLEDGHRGGRFLESVLSGLL